MSTLLQRQLRDGRLYGRLAQHRRRRESAAAGIAAMREVAPNSYVSLSWGKQSIVVAHMLYQVAPGTPMYFLASWESWAMHDFERVIDIFCRRWPINLRIVQTDHVSGTDRSWKEARDAGDDDLASMTPRERWDGWYWGLAKDESRFRRLSLSTTWDGQPHPTILRYSDGRLRCCPLANWTLLDLAAYIGEHDIPLLSAYHEGGLEARTTARLTKRAAEAGGVAAIRRRDVAAFNRLCARFPELRVYG